MSSASSRSSPTPFDAAIDAAAAVVVAAMPTGPSVVIVDGRSGSGKTTLAARIADRMATPVTVVALDDLYPGWDGLDEGVAEAVTRVLEPRRRGEAACWRRWDWAASAWAETHDVPAGIPLIVEGSGALTPASAAVADLTVWLGSPVSSRRARALARDGDLYRPHWDRWAAQEERHVTRDDPRSLADLVLEIP